MIDPSNLNTGPMPISGSACGRCRFWSKGSVVAGQCRRMPPAADFESGHFWPITGRSDWCGEFAAAPKKEGE